MSDKSVKLGEPICIEIPKDELTCDVKILPKPKLSTVIFKKSCGVQVQIYEPGDFELHLICQHPQAEASETFVYQAHIEKPNNLQSDFQYQVQPWVTLPPRWGQWIWSGVQGIVGLLLIILLCRWIYKQWFVPKKKMTSLIRWDPEGFLRQLQRLELTLAENKRGPKKIAFDLTALFFSIARAAPDSGIQEIFSRAYQESVQELLEMKFNPNATQTGLLIEKLLLRYQPSLREAVIREKQRRL
jgi:hypothetical protein